MRYSKEKKFDSDIESLIKGKNVSSKFRWYPTSLYSYELDLSHGIFESLNSTIRKNIAYSLQYLDFLELQLQELILSDVLYVMTYKNYIITAASIIESVFYHILFYHNKLKYNYFEKPTLVDTKTETINGQTIVHVKGTKVKLENPKLAVQDFHFLIIEVLKGKFLDITDNKRAKKFISHCKELRKRVHLHLTNNPYSSDYHKFNHKDYALMRFVLFRILSDTLFGKDKQKIFPKEKENSVQMIIKYRYIYD